MKTNSTLNSRTLYANLTILLGAREKNCAVKKENLLARLLPKNKDKTVKTVDWTKSTVLLRDRSKEKMLTVEEVTSLLGRD